MEYLWGAIIILAICLVLQNWRMSKWSFDRSLNNVWHTHTDQQKADQQQAIDQLKDAVLEFEERVEQYEEKLDIYQKTMESVLAQEVELTKGINQTNSMVMGHIAAGIPAATWWGLDLGGDPQKMREVTCTAEEEEPKKINLSEKITKEDLDKFLEKLSRSDYKEHCF